MKATDLVLTHGYFLYEDSQEQKIMMPYPPLGLLSISAYLEEQGLGNVVLDTTFSNFESWKKEIASCNPRAVCFYATLMTRRRIIEMASFIRKTEIFKNTVIIAGGPDTRHYAHEYLSHGFDHIVYGEGEQALHELLNALLINSSERMDGIAGIARLEKGRLVMNDERPLIADLDRLPFPARNKIDLNQYLSSWKKQHGYSSINISTMRGCPYSCNWCSKSIYGNSVRRRSAASVVAELEMLYSEYSFDRIWFVDDVFTLSKTWIQEFASLVASRGLKLQYEIITRADRLDQEIMLLLKQSGCYRMWIGAESGSPKVLEMMNRRTDPANVTAMMKLAAHHGISTGVFVMLGYKGETEKDIKLTAAFLKESAPDIFTITLAYPIKGTAFYKDIEPELTALPDWATHSDRDLSFRRTYPSGYYRHAIRYVYNAAMAHRSAPGISKLKFLIKSMMALVQMRAAR